MDETPICFIHNGRFYFADSDVFFKRINFKIVEPVRRSGYHIAGECIYLLFGKRRMFIFNRIAE